jgi:hypothetical protein
MGPGRRVVMTDLLRRPVLAAELLGTATVAHAAPSAEDLAKLAQNPVGSLISVPFQNNTNFNVGPQEKTQNILNIQPVFPIEVTPEWNVITRTILPVVSQPALFPGDDRTNGIGPAQLSAFLSPAQPKGGLIWGVGAVAQIPTTSDSAVGSFRWGLGPTFVLLHLDPASPWVYGVLVNNIWSVGGTSGEPYNNLLVQPFLNYNLPGGTYFTTSPVVTANWKADSSERWTVPLGGGIGHIFHLGKLPVNAQIGAYYNVERPRYAANWQVRAQVQLMFPK